MRGIGSGRGRAGGPDRRSTRHSALGDAGRRRKGVSENIASSYDISSSDATSRDGFPICGPGPAR